MDLPIQASVEQVHDSWKEDKRNLALHLLLM